MNEQNPTVVQNLNKAKKNRPIDVVAKLTGISTDTLSRINQIYESNYADIKEKVNNRELSVNAAYKAVKKRENDEALVVFRELMATRIG
jgi:hypothetical protein